MKSGKNSGSTRRTCIKLLAATASGTVAGVGGAITVGKLGRAPEKKWRVLSEHEAETLGALVEQIIPADDYPGARDSGGVNFIDRQLDGPYTHQIESYRNGLANLDALSHELHNTPFTQLEWNTQTRLLEMLEAGKTPGSTWHPGQARSFFNMVLDHTMQGFYGSPRHGGNRSYVSYRMMGVEYPHYTGRNRHPCTTGAQAQNSQT